MMQHVDHDNVADATRRQGKLLCVGNGIKPRRELNVGRDHVAKAVLEIADAAADLDRRSWNTDGGDPIVEIIVDRAQNRLALPHRTIVLQRIWNIHGALIRRNANHSMRNSNSPWRKREICVSP